MGSYIYDNHNSKSFYVMAWIAFSVAMAGMVLGLFYLELDIQTKAFLGMTFLFAISSSFTLAKVVRDKFEAEKFINKIETAKTEKFLNETKVTE